MMTRCLASLMGLVLWVGTADARNLLQNSSFEERDPQQQAYPAHWTEMRADTGGLSFVGEHYQGAAGGLMVGDGTPHGWRQNVLVLKAKALTLSAMIKADHVSLAGEGDDAIVGARIIYTNRPLDQATQFNVKILPGSYDWKSFSVAGVPVKDAEIERIEVSVFGKFTAGNIYVDQVELTENRDLSPEGLLAAKVKDLQENLNRVGDVDQTVKQAAACLDEAQKLLAGGGKLNLVDEQWVKAARGLSHEAWAAMFPQAMSDKPVEAQMLYHGIGQDKESTDRYLSIAQQMGCNGMFQSLGGWSSVIHHSELVPVEPGWEKFDALKYVIEEGHRRGIKQFAYYAALCGTSSPPTGAGTIYAKHPDWFAKGPDKNMPTFPDPANPEVVEFTVKVFTELATKYDLDGIGLDYIRYPVQNALNYDENNRAQIKERYGFDIMQGGDLWNDPVKWKKIQEYRAEKVGHIIERVHDAVKKVKPNMPIMACLISEPDQAYGYGQNWPDSSRWIDYGFPMNYNDLPLDLKLLKDQRDIFGRNHALFIPAVGGMPELHQEWTISKWAQCVAATRAAGCDGIIVYRMDGLDPAVAAFFGKGPFYRDTKFPEPLVRQASSR